MRIEKRNMTFGKLRVKEVINKTLVRMNVEKLYRNYKLESKV